MDARSAEKVEKIIKKLTDELGERGKTLDEKDEGKPITKPPRSEDEIFEDIFREVNGFLLKDLGIIPGNIKKASKFKNFIPWRKK